MQIEVENSSKRRCMIFNCDHMRGNICCADCSHKSKCKNPCLNNPHRCGQVKVEVVDNEKRQRIETPKL